jgi:adenylate kinase family enzyme
VKGVVDPASAAARIRSANKVHVVGGPGVGKSSFAAALARACNLELHRLDETAFEGPDFRPRPEEVTLAEARAIAEEERWIAEGIFIGWVDPLFESADVIVWLDHVTWSAAARRIASRWFRQAIREPVVRRGTERFFRFRDYARNLRHLVRVVVTSREYWSNSATPRRYTLTRAQLYAALAQHQHKVIHVTRPDEAETLLRLIEPAHEIRYGSG